MKAFFKILLVLFACYSLSTFAQHKTGPVKEIKQIFHVHGSIDLASMMSQQSDPKAHLIIKLVYPQLQTEKTDAACATFNALMNQHVQNMVYRFRKEAKKNANMNKRLPKKMLINELMVDYNASIQNWQDRPLISIRFNIQSYLAGMAHPRHDIEVINYDLRKQKVLKLTDLFEPKTPYLNVIANYARTNLGPLLQDKNMLEQGTTPTAAHYALWNIRSEGLLFSFPENQVAPYVNGVQKVLVPYRRLRNMLRPDAPLTDCLKHVRECEQNMVVTGGFLDGRPTRLHTGAPHQ